MYKYAATLILALSCSYSFGGFNNALKSYDSGDFEEAFYAFRNLAYIGHKPSQLNVGVMYLKGEYVDKDPVEAYAWIHLAEEIENQQSAMLSEKIFSAMSQKLREAANLRSAKLQNLYGRDSLEKTLAPIPLNDNECVEEVKQISIPAPDYPWAAEQELKIGTVQLTANISANGYARDISLRVHTDPLFFEAAARALSQSRWAPKKSHGQYVTVSGVATRFNFTAKGIELSKSTLDQARIHRKLAEEGDADSQYRYANTLSLMRSYQDQLNSEIDLQYKDANKWFYKSAKAGNPMAQYEIGWRMTRGRGCVQDINNGKKWLRAAAIAGIPFAQEELAMSSLLSSADNTNRAIVWLRQAVRSEYFAPKLLLAWELSTNADPDIRDGLEAQVLLESEVGNYFDNVRIFETKAAVFAELQKFKKAIKWQKKAIRLAKRNKWEIPIMEERLEAYKANKNWIGVYHVPVPVI